MYSTYEISLIVLMAILFIIVGVTISGLFALKRRECDYGANSANIRRYMGYLAIPIFLLFVLLGLFCGRIFWFLLFVIILFVIFASL